MNIYISAPRQFLRAPGANLKEYSMHVYISIYAFILYLTFISNTK